MHVWETGHADEDGEETAFDTHQPTWVDFQQLWATLFTADWGERQDLARKHGTGLRGQADSHCQTARPTPVKVSGLGTLFTRLLLLED